MANCRSKKTGLPMNIWIDETGSYLKGHHSKRIKFQINTNPKFQTENTCSMTLDGVIPRQQEEKMVLSKDFNLSSSDVEEVKNFVLNNMYALDKIADQKLDIEDFWTFAILGGAPVSPKRIEELKKDTDLYSF